MQSVNSWPPPSGPSRAVRAERWVGRTFYASQCRFFLDVPLDMSGMIASATREAAHGGHELVPGGLTLATDAIYRGAVLVEVQDPGIPLANVVHLDGEVLGRALPDRGVKLRAELDELVRWSLDLGLEVTACYVQYESKGPLPGAVKATNVYATIRGEESITDLPPPPR